MINSMPNQKRPDLSALNNVVVARPDSACELAPKQPSGMMNSAPPKSPTDIRGGFFQRFLGRRAAAQNSTSAVAPAPEAVHDSEHD